MKKKHNINILLDENNKNLDTKTDIKHLITIASKFILNVYLNFLLFMQFSYAGLD